MTDRDHPRRPVQAAFASALAFATGAAVPLVVAVLSAGGRLVLSVAIATLICLAALGWLAARTGGARVLAGTLRVLFWGALAMAITAAIGALTGTRPG